MRSALVLPGRAANPTLHAGKFFSKGGDPPVQVKLEDAFRGKRKRITKTENDEKAEDSGVDITKPEKGALFVRRSPIISSTGGVSCHTISVATQSWRVPGQVGIRTRIYPTDGQK